MAGADARRHLAPDGPPLGTRQLVLHRLARADGIVVAERECLRHLKFILRHLGPRQGQPRQS